ncbi:hypothetical protein FSP39_006240 [Pinctada imbricata]|uniref:Uncharacterized protein n=1 Tax=Pinctada imbricata TaxID=66713 RepID=A0AA89BWY7_PINIB|nr:hypothetical protein FSP39_006240 [Pinctada imbricata]
MTQHEIGRYVVVHHYGGIYADLDVERIGDIHDLLEVIFLKKQRVILHLGNLNLAGNVFFAAPKRHPFLEHVMFGLSESNRWYIIPYLNVMFTTGATYFHGCYRNYRYKGEMLVLADSNEYVLHHRASSWLRWDGEVIVWFDKRRFIVKISLILLVLCTGIKIYFVLKKMRIQSKEESETIFKQQK